MSEETKKFLDEVREERAKRVRGLIIDTHYFEDFLKSNDEDKLRAELEEERAKDIKDANGRVVKEEANQEKIKETEKKIQKIKGVKMDKLKHEEVLKDLLHYTETICQNPSEELIAKLDGVKI